MNRLFKRFGKLEDPNKLNEEGIGLGLTICQAIVLANQGQIQLLSDGPTKGTLVIFSMRMESICNDELSYGEDRSESVQRVPKQNNSLRVHSNPHQQVVQFSLPFM